MIVRLLGAGLAFLATAAAAMPPVWDSAPWLADLAQIRTAIDHDYPNRDWLLHEREAPLDRWFDRAAAQIREGRDDADARRALDGLIEQFRDGHVELEWPSSSEPGPPQSGSSPAQPPASAAEFCATRGYDAGQITPGTAVAMPGFRPMPGAGPFAAGLIKTGGDTVGIVRIGVFQPQGYPALCERAVRTLAIPIAKPCDEGCEDRILTEAYALLTRGLIATVEQLRAAGATVLLVDLTRNGGGSEWAEAAARVVSPIRLRSAAVGVFRSEQSALRWRDLAKSLRVRLPTAPAADRAELGNLAARADAIASSLTPCAGPGCAGLVRAGFATGLVADGLASRFAGRSEWADVFNPAQFPYRDGVWAGPAIVLIDGETWSAAEQFAAVLRDNRAAVVMGERTGGAGCGHQLGDEPFILSHSKARLHLPNCVRFRADGSNEVNGVVPDIPTGVRWNDGPAFAGRLTAARLSDAVAAARRMIAGRRN